MASEEVGVVAGFGTTHQAEDAIRSLREASLDEIEVYSPVPHDFNDAMGDGDSPIWAVSLTGGILGCFTGYGVSTLCAYVYPLIVGGKGFNTPIPYTVIGFELTILFTGIFTVLGVFLMGGLVQFKTPKSYRPRFSHDQFGVFVSCEGDDQAKAEELLRAAGAQDVERL